MANLVASGLFGDGAAAVVAVGSERADRLSVVGPRVLATRSHLYPDTEGVMGWDIGSDGFGIVLTAEVPDLVHQYLGPDIRALLGAHGLTVQDIGAWVSHPGGPKIIEAIEAELGRRTACPGDDVAIAGRGRQPVVRLGAARAPGHPARPATAPREPGRC